MLLDLHLCAVTCLAILLGCGYLCGLLAHHFKLPALLGYLATGVLLGPSIFNVMSSAQLHSLGFITDISLGCIAFIIGTELHLASLKKLGKGIILIILAESFMAFIVVTAAIFLLTNNLPLAILLGSMAPASAPAGTVAVIQEYKAKGTLTKALYAVVGFDDGLAVIIFSFALAFGKLLLVTKASAASPAIFSEIITPIYDLGFSLVLGAGIGGALCLIIKKITQDSDRLVIIFCAILLCVGLAGRWHISAILCCMMVGFMLVNTSKSYLVKQAKEPLQQMMGMIFILFFGLAGFHLDLSTIPAIGSIGIVYIVARITGKLFGAKMGAKYGNMEEKIRKYLGFAILSQAGVAIGLALLIQQQLSYIAGAEALGVLILSTVTATSIVFEIIGPLAAKYALNKAGEIAGE